MKTLYGVTAAMTTPFTKFGEVDEEALEQQTSFLIGKGVDCLYPCGTTGEMYLMSEAERRRTAETVVRKTQGRATVFIHCGAMHQDETIRLARHAAEIGADGIGAVTPSYFGVSDEAMAAYYRAICAELPADFPVYVYVIPQLAKNDVTPACMRRIADACPNVIGVKYSFADMRRMIEYVKIRSGTFSVVFGPDDLFLPALTMGCAGTVSGCASCVPEPFVSVYRAFLSGDFTLARQEQMKCFEVAKILGGGADMSVFKRVQTMRGIRGGQMKPPLGEVDGAEFDQIWQALAPYLPD